VVSGVQGVHKPDPEIFWRAAAYAGVAPAQCIYVGDHPVNDIEGATAAGMHPVYLDAYEKHAVSAVPRITAPGELLSLLGI
jgi:putative hydrolase of the HAD superfamily